MKFLLVLAVLVIAWYVWRNDRPRVQDDDSRKRRPGKPSAGLPPPPQPMVSCARCGLFLPRQDALPGHGERLYCCAAHRDADR